MKEQVRAEKIKPLNKENSEKKCEYLRTSSNTDDKHYS
jgi:hypothetical protein